MAVTRHAGCDGIAVISMTKGAGQQPEPPVAFGDPIFRVGQIGLKEVISRLIQCSNGPDADPAVWEPAQLLARLAAEGKTFN